MAEGEQHVHHGLTHGLPAQVSFQDTLQALAGLFGYSDYYVSKRFKKQGQAG